MRRESVAVVGAVYRRTFGDWSVATRKRVWKQAIREAGGLPSLMAELARSFPPTEFTHEGESVEAHAVSVQFLAALAGYRRQKHFNQAVQAINRQGADDHHSGEAPRFYACPQGGELRTSFWLSMEKVCIGLSRSTKLGLRLYRAEPIGVLSEHHDARLSSVGDGVEETRLGYEAASRVAAEAEQSRDVTDYVDGYAEFRERLGVASSVSVAAGFLTIHGGDVRMAEALHRAAA